jgi:hypothetical protein
MKLGENVGLHFRNLKYRGEIKPFKFKYIEYCLCHGKFWRENSIYDMRWGAHAFPFFTIRLLDFSRG